VLCAAGVAPPGAVRYFLAQSMKPARTVGEGCCYGLGASSEFRDAREGRTYAPRVPLAAWVKYHISFANRRKGEDSYESHIEVADLQRG
jgi:hypothetical protein